MEFVPFEQILFKIRNEYSGTVQLNAFIGNTQLKKENRSFQSTNFMKLNWTRPLNNKKLAQGFWDIEMSQKHSNIRELMAVLLSIRAFRSHIENKTIQILSDNVTTVAYINHMGGPIEELTDIAKLIWAEAVQYNITIVARHLSGKLNTLADGLSRAVDKHEWMLARPLFLCLDEVWGLTL